MLRSPHAEQRLGQHVSGLVDPPQHFKIGEARTRVIHARDTPIRRDSAARVSAGSAAKTWSF
jgi:hypothetical protein